MNNCFVLYITIKDHTAMTQEHLYASGSTATAESLFRMHYKDMYRMAYTLLHDAEESRDVVQSVFLRLIDRRVALEPQTARSYLLTATRHACLNLMSRKKAEERMQQFYPRDLEAPLLSAEEQEQRWRAINRFIDKGLTPQTSRVLRLCYDKGLSYREVADKLGISVAAVNKHMVQALRKLRERFNSTTL